MSLLVVLIIVIASLPLMPFLYRFSYRLFLSLWYLVIPIKLENIKVKGENGEIISLTLPAKTARRVMEGEKNE